VAFEFFRDLRFEQVIPGTAPGWAQTEPTPMGRTPASHSWLAYVGKWHRRRRSRTALSLLNEHMLKDIGLTYAEAEREANKPFWQP
jgi:uncharacterized protein YjiS (DUF1127 family)